MSNRLDSEQDGRFVRPDLGPISLKGFGQRTLEGNELETTTRFLSRILYAEQ